ncbi:transglycosylase domain-containing protein [Candidatus Microgenomates bacterium]|nr:transglycosylase domain-containing protein [Candidatus Microgenomates bacterium]
MLSLFNQRQLRKKLGSLIPNNKARLYSTIATLLVVGIVVFVISTTALFAWYSKDLPRPDKVRRVEGFSTIIYDRNGEVLYDVYADKNRIPVEFKDLPLSLRNATIAIEDKSFYQHQGFDPVGYLRAVKQIIFYRNLAGGSTLTQQLVKNVLLTSERTLPRKIKEFILAIQIEKKYTKDEILQMYLNEAPYGGTAWGVEAASKTYFNKHTKDLNLIESAVLAGLPQSPTLYNPFTSKSYIARTQDVLRRMREDKYITREQEQQAIKDVANLKLAPQGSNTIKAPHFVMYVREQLMKQFGEKMVEGGGLRVTTSLDYKIQEEAEKIVADEAAKLAPFKASNAAAVVLNPQTGEIVVMVGSKDYFNTDIDGNVNVVLAERQPGSAGKPILYATAFKQGYTPGSLLMDVKTDFPSGNPTTPIYTPVNYDGKFKGPVQIRFALGNSLNIPAVKMAALAGVKNVMQQGFDMGISTWQPTEENMKNVGLSLALGGREVKMLELASAYGVFATGGVRHDPVSILKVQTSDGKKLYEYKQTSGRKVLGEDIAFLISHILLDNNARSAAFGTNSYLVISGKTVAAKSGTTDQKRDNWTFGYTPSYVTGVWVGNNDNSPMNPTITSGVTGASPIWNKMMKFLLKDKKNEEFKKPDNVNAIEIDSLAGGLPVDGQAKRTEYFVKGTEPQSASPVYQRLKISKNDSTKLANEVEIAAGDYTEKDFLVFKENDPVSTDGKNRWQEGIDAWINSQSEEKYKFPKETSSGAEDRVVVKIKSPSNETQYNENDIQVEASAVAKREVVKMEVFANGNLKETKAGNFLSAKIHLDDGPYEIKFKGTDSAGNSSEVSVRIGVKVPWNYVTSTPTPTNTPTLTPSPSPTLTP